MEIGETIWQGDVGLRKIAGLPKGLKEKDKILAYGEVTGHMHRFREEDGNVQVFVDSSGQQFIHTTGQSELVHEQHDNHMLEAGDFEFVQMQELDIVEGTRPVLD